MSRVQELVCTLYCGDQLEVVNSYKCTRNLIIIGGGVVEQIASRIAKARSTFANLQRLWRRDGIGFLSRGGCAVR